MPSSLFSSKQRPNKSGYSYIKVVIKLWKLSEDPQFEVGDFFMQKKGVLQKHHNTPKNLNRI